MIEVALGVIGLLVLIGFFQEDVEYDETPVKKKRDGTWTRNELRKAGLL